jgi:Fur family ferric uptake transcriptional regulator
MKKDVFKYFLKDRGLRLTKEREAIWDEVRSTKGHFDPEELHLSMRQKGQSVSRASVYRTIPLMVEAGILEQVERTDKHAHYERTIGRSHHDHMLCTSCGKVIEFYSDALEKLQDRLCRQYGFEGVAHTLEITGHCKACGKDSRRSASPGRS